MINRNNRFSGHNAVARVRGASTHADDVSVRVARGRGADYRLAVVVSKKVDNRAVVRNRIRRRVFEVVRTSGVLDNQPLDVVIYVKHAHVATMPSAALHTQITRVIQKATARL